MLARFGEVNSTSMTLMHTLQKRREGIDMLYHTPEQKFDEVASRMVCENVCCACL